MGRRCVSARVRSDERGRRDGGQGGTDGDTVVSGMGAMVAKEQGVGSGGEGKEVANGGEDGEVCRELCGVVEDGGHAGGVVRGGVGGEGGEGLMEVGSGLGGAEGFG